MALNDYTADPTLDALDPGEAERVLGGFSKRNIAMYRLARRQARRMGAEVIVSGGASIPGMYFMRKGQTAALPIYHDKARLMTLEGSQYMGVQHLSWEKGTGKYAPIDAFDRVGDIIENISNLGGTSKEMFGRTASVLNKWRERRLVHHRSFHGGSSTPFWQDNKVRIPFMERAESGEWKKLGSGGPLGDLAYRLRANSRVMKDLTKLGGGHGAMFIQRLNEESNLRAQIAEAAQGYGLHTGNIKYLLADKKMKGYMEFSRLGTGALGLNPYDKFAKGSHQIHNLRAIDLQRFPLREMMPGLVDARFMERQGVVAGVEAMRGVNASRTLSMGGQSVPYLAEYVPVNVAAVGMRPGGSKFDQKVAARLGNILGDAATRASSDVGRYLASNSLEALSHREEVLELQRSGHRGIGGGVQVDDALMNMGPGQHQFVDSPLRTETGVLAKSAAGQELKLRAGEGMVGVYVNQGRMRVAMRGMPTGEYTGARMLLGKQRTTIAGRTNIVGNWKMGSATADFVAYAGDTGIDVGRQHLSTMVENARRAQMKVGGKWVSAADKLLPIIAKELKGQVLDHTVSGKGRVLRGKTIQVGADFDPYKTPPDQLAETLKQQFSGLKGKFRLNGREMNAIGLLDTQTSGLTLEQATALATDISPHSPGSIKGRKYIARAAQSIFKRGFQSLVSTTASMRNNQPGFTVGKRALRMTGGRLGILQSSVLGGIFSWDEQMKILRGENVGYKTMAEIKQIADPTIRNLERRRFLAKKLWSSVSTAGTGRGRSFQGAFSEVMTQMGAGDDALEARVKARGGKVMTIAEYRSQFGRQVNLADLRGGGDLSTLRDTPFVEIDPKTKQFRPTDKVVWVDSGKQYVARSGGEYSLKRRMIPVMPGRILGARTGHPLYEDKKLQLVKSQLDLHNALINPKLRRNLGEYASNASMAFFERVKGKRGVMNRGFFTSMKNAAQGGLLPSSFLKPGEIGLTEAMMKRMGMDKSMVEMSKEGKLFGLTFTDPAFSESHIYSRKIRLINSEMLKRMGSPQANAIYTHPDDLSTLQRDYDADRMTVATSKHINRALRMLHKDVGVASRSKNVRELQSSIRMQNMLVETLTPAQQSRAFRIVAEGARTSTNALQLFSKLSIGESEALATAERAMPGAGTGAAHTIAFGNYRMVRDIASGAPLEALGVSPSAMEDARMYYDEVRGALGEGSKIKYGVSKTNEELIYTVLKKGAKGARGGEFAASLFNMMGTRVDSPQWGTGIDSMVDIMRGMGSEAIAGDALLGSSGTARLEEAFSRGEFRDVARAMAGAVNLSQSYGALPIDAAIVQGRSRQGFFGAMGSMFRAFGVMLDPSGTDVVRTGAALQDNAAATAANMKHLQPDRAEALGELMNSGRRVAAKVGNFFKQNKWAQFGAVGLGVFGLLGSMSGGGDPEAPAGGFGPMPGSPLPPSPNMGQPDDTGMGPDFRILNNREARIQRVEGVRTHPHTTFTSQGRGATFMDLGAAAHGRQPGSMLHSGTFRDEASGPMYRQQLEHEIKRQLHSSF